MIPKLKDFLKSKISPQERRAAIVLLFFVALLMLRQRLLPIVYRYRYAVTPEEMKQIEAYLSRDSAIQHDHIALRMFDPNKDDLDTLMAKGVEDGVAENMINYRKKVKPFELPEDLLHLYKVDSLTYQKLKPFIVINRNKGVLGREKSRQYKAGERQEVRVMMNAAMAKDWMKLRGIGKVLSARIIKYRDLLGGFVNKSQLTEVYGVQDSVYLRLEPFLVLDSVELSQLQVNSSSYVELIRHPYLNKEQVDVIMRLRRATYSKISAEQLCQSKGFTTEFERRVLPYLTFEHN